MFNDCNTNYGVLKFGDKIYVPEDGETKKSFHPEATEMHQNLKVFCWPDKKREITGYVMSCLQGQNANIDH
jgi:hypothetical protein